MATKSAIRDTARVLDLPLFETDKIAINSGMMPGKWNLARFLNEDEVIRRRFVQKSLIKLKINRSGEDDLGGETIQQAKCWRI
jgi:DNA polymerase-3 subunit alpha